MMIISNIIALTWINHWIMCVVGEYKINSIISTYILIFKLAIISYQALRQTIITYTSFDNLKCLLKAIKTLYFQFNIYNIKNFTEKKNFFRETKKTIWTTRHSPIFWEIARHSTKSPHDLNEKKLYFTERMREKNMKQTWKWN